jgi:hypothetical protein
MAAPMLKPKRSICSMRRESTNVIRHLLVAERALDIGGAAVGLHLRRNDVARLRQERRQRARHLKRAHDAVQDQEGRVRAWRAVDFVVEIEPVHRRVTRALSCEEHRGLLFTHRR